MKKIIAILCLWLLATGTVFANNSGVPAPPYPIEVTLPDGTILTIRLIGDERGHKTYTVDGWQILQGEDEFYYYAKEEKDGTIVMSGNKAKNEQDRKGKERRFLKRKGIFRELPPCRGQENK